MEASPVRDVLRAHWLPGISNVTGKTTTPLKGWLTDGSYVLNQYDAVNGIWSFYTGVPNELTRAVAHDIARMAAACFESMHGVPSEKEIVRSTAWSLIRSYYAAFFAAHAFGRMFGDCVVHLEAFQSRKLNQAIAVSGLGPPAITDGLHVLVVDPTSQSFSLQKLANGPHEDSWSQFAGLLERLSYLSLSKTPYASSANRQTVSVLLDEIVDILRTPPATRKSNWLSYIRNEINYQHRHGAWYPHEDSKNFRHEVETILTSWHKQPTLPINPKSHPMARFSAACSALVALTRELVEEMAARNPDNDSFLKHQVLPVLKQAA